MNMKVIGKYLQYLRKSYNYTQDDLAGRLAISRQAISKWETGATIPDLEVLLELSKLYGISINDILEPEITQQRITDFEQISTIPQEEIKEILGEFDRNSLLLALMGASPELNNFFKRIFPEINDEMMMNRIGRVKVEQVEDMHRQIVALINLCAMDRKDGRDGKSGR
ncbi:MAG: helix-turn-helix domain-containing protein [Lachnospiraceae bacterium]|nr:helix-turn-helix domain-containing protein [Lachnospiraceae bacterium]